MFVTTAGGCLACVLQPGPLFKQFLRR